ncbi:MAG: long-chain fatty acid--CoA ligase [Bacteroidota bacterium]
MSIQVQFSTIPEMFEKITSKFSGDTRPVLMYKVEKKYQNISYKELREKIEYFILGLSQIGLNKNNTVAIISENRPEWVIADIATLSLGAVDVPIYPTSTPEQIAYIFNNAEVKIAIVSNQFQLNKVLSVSKKIKSLKQIIVMNQNFQTNNSSVVGFNEIILRGEKLNQKKKLNLKTLTSKIKPSDVVTIIYTSGTTGKPKGVVLTNNNIVSNIKSSIKVIPMSESDTLLSFLPLCHIFERMGGYYTAFACGATIAYAETVETVASNLLEIKPTKMTSVPRMFERLQSKIIKQVDSGTKLKKNIFYWALSIGNKFAHAKKRGFVNPILNFQHSIANKLVFKKLQNVFGGRLQFFISGGAALPQSIGEFFEAIGIKILEGYGLSETSPVLSINTLDDYKFGTVGKPIENVTIRIAEDGEILAKGPNIMKCYYKNPKATNEVIDKNGWFHTGDIGSFDEQGHLKITDRKKHLFVSSGGKNIAPQPIENKLLKSKFIDQLMLIGDARMYLTALIVTQLESVLQYAKDKNIVFRDQKELLTSQEIHDLIKDEVGELQKDLSSYEQVRKFVLLHKPFSIEDGELTPTLKIKRKIVEEKYKKLIESMYQIKK